MNEHVIVLSDRSSLQPFVRLVVQIEQSKERYLWRILEVCEISGYASEEAAMTGAYDIVNALFFAITRLGITPDTQLVSSVLKHIVKSAGG